MHMTDETTDVANTMGDEPVEPTPEETTPEGDVPAEPATPAVE